MINKLIKNKLLNDSKDFIIKKSFSSFIETKVLNDIFLIKFCNSKKKNCLNFESINFIKCSLNKINSEKTINKIVFYGEKNFSSGFDLNEFNKNNEDKILNLYFDNNWFKNDKPMIAIIEGFAVGLGFEIALGCDYIIAKEDAKFGYLNRRFSIPLMLNSQHKLRKLIGIRKSFHLIDSGAIIDSKEALNLGIVNFILDNNSTLEESLNSLKELQINKNEEEKYKLFTYNDFPDDWKNVNSLNYDDNKNKHSKFMLSFYNDLNTLTNQF